MDPACESDLLADIGGTEGIAVMSPVHDGSDELHIGLALLTANRRPAESGQDVSYTR